MLRFLCVAFVACHASARQEPAPAGAAEIVAAMAAAYRAAPSYFDHGNVSTVFISAGERRKLERPFEIAFVRGGEFRFEFRESGDPDRAHIVWSDGTRTLVERKTGEAGVEEVTDLNAALAGAAGVSGGSAHRTPQLLFPDRLGGFSIVELNGVKVDGSDVIDGRACWRVVGTHPRSGHALTLWIDRESHLLRQTFQRDDFPARAGVPAFTSETTIRYNPVIGQPIDPASLQAPAVASWVGVRVDDKPVRVTQVIRGAPGDKAGIQIGDEIVSVDGESVASGPAFVQRVRGSRAGTKLAVIVARAGSTVTLTVAVAPRPSSLATSALVGRPAPGFAAATLSGSGPTELAALRGRVVVIDFWATWCGPCAITIPHLNELHAKHAASGLSVVGLSSEDPDLIKRFVGAKHIAYAIGHDPDDKIADQYLREGVPMFVVIDRNGVVRNVISGANMQALDAAVAEALR